jgi:hypothetical protein
VDKNGKRPGGTGRVTRTGDRAFLIAPLRIS